MSMIPKKEGHRTVATMASGYRTYTSRDAEEDRRWNIYTSHVGDSPNANTSSRRAAEERRIEQEMLTGEGYNTLVILRDFAPFHDTIQYDVLQRERVAQPVR